jgi:hypothetical protein
LINWTAFNWQAFATIATGLLAVAAATFVAWQQVRLKRQELRLSLFEKRKGCLDQFRLVASDFNRTGRFSQSSVSEIQRLLNEVKLLFNDAVIHEIDELWDAAFLQYHHTGLTKSYRDDGMMDEARNSAKETSKNSKKALTSIPKTIKLLENATRIDGNL